MSESVQPRAQAEVLDKSILALDCLALQAEGVFPTAQKLDLALAPVINARETLKHDLEQDLAQNPNNELRLAAEQELRTADAFIGANSHNAYQQMRVFINGLISSTNIQLRQSTADPLTWSKNFTNILPTPVGGTATSLFDSKEVAREIFGNDGNILKNDIENLRATYLPATNAIKLVGPVATIHPEACLPGTTNLVVTPPGPLLVNAGKKYAITVTGGQHSWSWEGKEPADINVTQTHSSKSYQLSIKDVVNDKGPFTLVFSPIPTGSSAKVMITVQ